MAKNPCSPLEGEGRSHRTFVRCDPGGVIVHPHSLYPPGLDRCSPHPGATRQPSPCRGGKHEMRRNRFAPLFSATTCCIGIGEIRWIPNIARRPIAVVPGQSRCEALPPGLVMIAARMDCAPTPKKSARIKYSARDSSLLRRTGVTQKTASPKKQACATNCAQIFLSRISEVIHFRLLGSICWRPRYECNCFRFA
jgi:hypothetical protein